MSRHALRHAADDRFGDLRRQPSGRQVIQEEERLGALHEDVVDAVIDEVGADRVVRPAMNATLQLGADAVGAGDENRIANRPGSSWNSPPNEPMSDRTPAVKVERASERMRRTVSLPASMSTPEALVIHAS